MSDAQQLRVLIHKILLPRLRRLEDEVHSLRKHTWPYVQHMKERNQLDDMEMKVDFFRHLDDEGVAELLRLKSKYAGNTGFLTREYDTVTRLRNNFC
jgi:hypothetical protein